MADMLSICTCHAFVPLLHSPQFPNAWDCIIKGREPTGKDQTIRSIRVAFEKPRLIDIRQQ